jgi:hypothetical protein
MITVSLVWFESMANGLAGGQLCCHGNHIPDTIKQLASIAKKTLFYIIMHMFNMIPVLPI